jgi:hypothetical protein
LAYELTDSKHHQKTSLIYILNPNLNNPLSIGPIENTLVPCPTMKKPNMYMQNKKDPDGQIQRRSIPRYHKIKISWFCCLSYMHYYCMLFPQTEVNGLALLKLEHSFIEKYNRKKMSQCHIPVPNSDQTK